MLDYCTVGSYETNCYLFACDKTKIGVLIDPGDEAAKILQWVQDAGVKVEYILITHGHDDHIKAVGELREKLGAKVAISRADADMLTNPEANLSPEYGIPYATEPAEEFLTDGQVIHVGQEELRILATPGHTPGGISILTSAGLFSGDTLFAGTVGRTDFPGGSYKQLLTSIWEKLLVLPDETPIYPGHMHSSTIGAEKRGNPHLVHGRQ